MNTSTLPGPATAATAGERSVTLANLAEVAGRSLLALLFLLSGVGKVAAYSATATYMSATGVPAALLPAVIAL